LDYTAVETVMRIHTVDVTDRRDALSRIQVMEYAALQEFKRSVNRS
jgi:hypothetical protein